MQEKSTGEYQNSLRRIARWVTKIIGKLDLTPSDSALALVLVATLQRKARRCALLPLLTPLCWDALLPNWPLLQGQHRPGAAEGAAGQHAERHQPSGESSHNPHAASHRSGVPSTSRPSQQALLR